MLEYLNKLTKKEVNKFRNFIISPYYNTNKNVIKLHKYLSSLHPNITKENSNNKILFRRNFRKGRYEDIVVRRIISMYLKVFEKFLIQLGVESNVVDSNLKLTEICKERTPLQKTKCIIITDV